jgi:ABC-type lipoprotein export system ATPase subunit
MKLFMDLARKRSGAIVIVTHDGRMLGYADRIVDIEDGRLAGDRRHDRSAAPADPGHTNEDRYCRLAGPQEPS